MVLFRNLQLFIIESSNSFIFKIYHSYLCVTTIEKSDKTKYKLSNVKSQFFYISSLD